MTYPLTEKTNADYTVQVRSNDIEDGHRVYAVRFDQHPGLYPPTFIHCINEEAANELFELLSDANRYK